MLLSTTLRQNISTCIDFFLPAACAWCGALLPATSRPEMLCESCGDDIQSVQSSCCPRCALPHVSSSTTGHYCGKCLADPPPFEKVHAVGRHANALKQAIHRFKYRDNPALNACLGGLLKDLLDKGLDSYCPELIVPVPAHPRRLKQRGYNQALELARPVAKHLQIPLAANLLQRRSATPAQLGLNARQRHDNLREAFILREQVTARRILLIDDVMTTTATARECCKVLLKGGARQIHVAILARA